MIILPMAGLSSRFFKNGYTKPKFMLPIDGTFVFDKVLESFKKYYKTEHFIFIIRETEFKVDSFIKNRLEVHGIESFEIVTLNRETKGQAETVQLGLLECKHPLNESITIFNIDTFRPNFEYPEEFDSRSCSYLETFIGEGKNWSNVIPKEEGSNDVAQALEKKEASKFCCTGLYHFESASLYKKTYEEYEKLENEQELYIAPMYNLLVDKHPVKFTIINKNEVIFCGTPDEYEALL